VYLHIDLNKEQDNRRAWETKYPSKGSGIPQVTIVSSDGRELHNQSGGVGLDDLTGYLAKSGKLLPERALAQIRAAVEAAQKALDAGDVTTAVSTIAPVLGTGGAGEDVQKAEEFGKQLIEDAQAKFKAVEEKLASAETALDAAVEVLQMSRDYARLRPLAEDLKKLGIVQRHKDHREVFEQARLLDQAALRMATKNKKDAVAKYELVIRKWPDTAAAKYASTKLSELGENVIVVDLDGSKNAAAGDKGDASKTAGSSAAKTRPKLSQAVAERTAKSLLDTAEVLASINQKDQARQKAQEVIDLVPGTELAKKAEALIKKL
jgi:tetratricopeptide (TPR) repeat protein